MSGGPIHGERMTLVVIELEPGAEVPEHSHDNEQLGVLLQGSMSFTIGGEQGEVRPGSFWRILSNVPHSVVAGPDGAVAVEVFAPPRAEWAGLPPAEPGAGRWP